MSENTLIYKNNKSISYSLSLFLELLNHFLLNEYNKGIINHYFLFFLISVL